MPNYQPTRSSWSTTPCVESQIGEYLSDEAPHRRPAQAIGTQFSSMGREGRPFQHRARARSSIFKQDDIDSQASGSTLSESFTSHNTRPLSNTHESSPGNHIVSPVPSLCRARARALMVTGTSGFSRLGETEDDGNPSIRGGDRRSNGAERRDFRSYGSPFSQRVKEKLREAHVKGPGSPRRPGCQAAELPAPVEDDKHGSSPEIQGADLHPFYRIVVGLQMILGHLSQSQGSSTIRDPASLPESCMDGSTNLPQIKPLHVRAAKPRLLMGPRNLNVAPAPGSVMERVRMIEGRDLTGRRDQT